MNDVDELIRQRIQEALSRRSPLSGDRMQEIKMLRDMARPHSEASVFAQQRAGINPEAMRAPAAGGGISPEDYSYFVDISRRDVRDQEGNRVGWDKAVHRWADPRNKAPRLGDLSDEGMRTRDKKKSRDAMSQPTMDEFFGGY